MKKPLLPPVRQEIIDRVALEEAKKLMLQSAASGVVSAAPEASPIGANECNAMLYGDDIVPQNNIGVSQEKQLHVEVQSPAATVSALFTMPPALQRFRLTAEAISEANGQEFILNGSIAKGKITTIYADPNQGKTTIAIAIGRLGNTIYLDAENPLDTFDEQSILNMHVLSASMGASIDDLKDAISWLGSADEHHIVIMDTLMHFADPNDHNQVLSFYSSLQKLRNKGHTVIVLHHTNKKEKSEGSNAKEFFGNSSIRSQSDNMLYLEGVQKPDGKLLVSLYPTKKRGYLETKSYEIDTLDFSIEPILEENPQQRLEDEAVIGLIKQFLLEGVKTTAEINNHLRDSHRVSTRKTGEVLNRYSEIDWHKGGNGKKRQWELISTPS